MPVLGAVNPTRMELIKLNRKIALARKGHRLLKEKRDALIVDFLDSIKKGTVKREEIENFFVQAYKNLTKAKALMGSNELRNTAMAVREAGDIELEEKNIIGVKVPMLKLEAEERNIGNRGYSPFTTSVTLDEAADDFEQALQKVVEIAEIEKTMRLLAVEVEKTKRRVNALEYIVIPRMEGTSRFIKMRLDEIEREDFSRLKKIKAKLAR